jgi:hypothetical protein
VCVCVCQRESVLVGCLCGDRIQCACEV